MKYIVQFNDGRVMHNIPKGEAKFWLWLSMEYITCNVYEANGGGTTVAYI